MSFERKIWKGVPTRIEENPWQAALLIDEDLCGGSVLAEQWIVAAAH
ncbi:trypsin-like serine protease [Mesorhizobium sp. B283B1A]|nr:MULTISPECIES: trypsin-like serine protease [Mesorhizobium]MCA0045924.1 trypsin-like serine protease [Mesorhizobium sp. B283B1A]UQS64666.1 trypsin-like serine protease [Mesorhizobium opportunistum]